MKQILLDPYDIYYILSFSTRLFQELDLVDINKDTLDGKTC